MNALRNTYLSNRFFALLIGLILLFFSSFFVKGLYLVASILGFLFCGLVIFDWLLLFVRRTTISAERQMAPILSLGDDNKVRINIVNKSKLGVNIEVIDELPMQFQIRDFKMQMDLKKFANKELFYDLRPVSRGEYEFGNVLLFISSRLGLVRFRIVSGKLTTIKVYPSVIQMKKFELYTSSKMAMFYGIKKLRRIGLSYEFEQIKNYIRGDDTRHINWKATGRHQELMVNQFVDEKSKSVYNIIDKSRIMMMPFNDQTLMDCAINTSLVVSNVALKKYDKVGLLTFGDQIGAVVKADNKPRQLQLILETLYNQKERELEANYELMYHGIKKMVRTRSLIFLYSNFESLYGLQRAIPILRKLNQQHLLIVVFFKNKEIEELRWKESKDLKGVYTNVLAEQAIVDKQIFAQELNNYGIQCILTSPEELSLNTINKYIELKSRGVL
jgi:uncharacterized protein (DUF58 family)